MLAITVPTDTDNSKYRNDVPGYDEGNCHTT